MIPSSNKNSKTRVIKVKYIIPLNWVPIHLNLTYLPTLNIDKKYLT